MSRITIIGNATSDVELRYTQSGIAVGSVNVAENIKSGEKEHTNFHRVTIWREMAEHAAASVHKGTRVIVVGRLDQREYETREGEKRTSWDVTADAIGPDLRFATAQVQRVEKQGGQAQGATNTPQAGGWPSAPVPSPQAAADPSGQWGQQSFDETPF